MRPTDIERFEKRIVKEPECWLWDKPQKRGYGEFMMGRESHYSHRASWILYRGEIPDGMLVCHTCDNRRCVNPSHLFLGTTADNAADMVKKDRQAKGVKNGSSRLTEANVIEIRKLYASGRLTQSEIGNMFGVTYVTVKKIADRKTWRHVQECPSA